MWVCDGYCLVETETYIPGRTNPQILHSDFLHCNWGWFGSYDGWFIATMEWDVGYIFPVSGRNMIHNIHRTYTYPYNAYF